MVQMAVCQKDIQRFCLDMLAYAKQSRTRIEDDADGGKHQASRVATFVGVIAAGT
jgi:hypothetical protein